MKQRHDITQCLRDILAAIDAIERFLGPTRNYYRYVEDELLRSGVERKLEIIGEATGRILRAKPDFKLENARKIVDTRNWVIHTYEKIDDSIIWGIVTKHLPQLRAEVEKLLAQAN